MGDRPDNSLENIQIINKVIPNCAKGSILTFFISAHLLLFEVWS